MKPLYLFLIAAGAYYLFFKEEELKAATPVYTIAPGTFIISNTKDQIN